MDLSGFPRNGQDYVTLDPVLGHVDQIKLMCNNWLRYKMGLCISTWRLAADIMECFFGGIVGNPARHSQSHSET